MARKAKLKVFRTQMGFHESIVAAPSKKAALEAWGTRQDLFREGAASLSDDPAEIAVATRHPGQVLRRPVGSKAAFAADAAGDLGDLNLPAAKPRQRAAPAAKGLAPPPPPPDRSALTAAEKALASLARDRDRDLNALAERRAELDAEARRIKAGFAEREARLRAALKAAQAAYRKAGGEN